MVQAHDQDTTRRRDELDREIARVQARIAAARAALHKAELKLRSLVPQTRTAQHAVGMFYAWFVTERMYHDELRGLIDELWQLDDLSEDRD